MTSASPSAAVLSKLDEFIQSTQSLFHSFLLARTSHELGSKIVDSLAEGTAVTATVGIGVQIEPIPITELRTFGSVYPNFVIEVFHGKFIQSWNDLLHDLVAIHLDLHLRGERLFRELKTRQLRFDFNDESSSRDQIRRGVLEAFDFEKYQDRIKTICRLFPASRDRDVPERSCRDLEDALSRIRHHVQIRNCFQHQNGILKASVFKELGCQFVELLDETGQVHSYSEGEPVKLSVPELDRLRRALMQVVHAWKN